MKLRLRLAVILSSSFTGLFWTVAVRKVCSAPALLLLWHWRCVWLWYSAVVSAACFDRSRCRKYGALVLWWNWCCVWLWCFGSFTDLFQTVVLRKLCSALALVLWWNGYCNRLWYSGGIVLHRPVSNGQRRRFCKELWFSLPYRQKTERGVFYAEEILGRSGWHSVLCYKSMALSVFRVCFLQKYGSDRGSLLHTSVKMHALGLKTKKVNRCIKNG